MKIRYNYSSVWILSILPGTSSSSSSKSKQPKLTLWFLSHQGEHRPQQGSAGHPRSQLPFQPLVQGTGEWFGLGDHPGVPEDAGSQEESQLFPHSHLLFGVRAHHRGLPMCHLEAQLIATHVTCKHTSNHSVHLTRSLAIGLNNGF